MSTYGGNEPSTRPARTDPPASGTTAGAETTSRMTGTHTGEPYPEDVRTVRGTDNNDTRTDVRRSEHVEAVRPTERPRAVLPAKTSAAATFALVFGLAALFCALTAILAPLAVLFGVIGIILAIAGYNMVKRPGVTGKGVATGGLVTAVLGLLLGGAVLAGAAVLVNDEQQLDRLENQIQDLRNDLPSTSELRDELPS